MSQIGDAPYVCMENEEVEISCFHGKTHNRARNKCLCVEILRLEVFDHHCLTEPVLIKR
jgi:hypothetical protein